MSEGREGSGNRYTPSLQIQLNLNRLKHDRQTAAGTQLHKISVKSRYTGDLINQVLNTFLNFTFSLRVLSSPLVTSSQLPVAYVTVMSPFSTVTRYSFMARKTASTSYFSPINSSLGSYVIRH